MRPQFWLMVVGSIVGGAVIIYRAATPPAKRPIVSRIEQPRVQAIEERKDIPVVDPREQARNALVLAASQQTLSELRARPRLELAVLCDEWLARIKHREQIHLRGGRQFALLPTLRLPMALAVWREARFSPAVGFSLPPYLAKGAHDNELARHLARHGDVEAALKLADPTDAKVQAEIQPLRAGRNYPLEWTRLVSLLLHVAQFDLVSGRDKEPARLIALHEQLRAALDEKARTGPLGALLLPRGQKVLRQAAAAWRAKDRADLAGQAESALARWGDLPPLVVRLAPGAARADIARVFGAPGKGKAVRAAPVLRALDLLCLPLPDDGVEAVVACLDDSERLTDVLVTYRPRLCEEYPQPSQLAHLFEEVASPLPQKEPTADELRRAFYSFGGQVGEVGIVPSSPCLGGFVRLGMAGAARPPVTLARHFAGVDFDRSFEQNRVHVALDRRGDVLNLDDADALGRVRNPAAALTLTQATLTRESGHDVLARVELRWAAPKGYQPLASLALPLWELAGSGRIETSGTGQDGHLVLRWEDTRTRYVFRVPNFAGRALDFEAADRTEAKSLPQRAAAVRAHDRAERKARFEAKEALVRLPRELLSVRLGMARADVTAALPAGEQRLLRDLPGGLICTFAGKPPARPVTAREVIVRFDLRATVTELRVRFVPGQGQAGALGQLLEQIKKDGGEPETLPSPWERVWADRPAAGKAVLYCWRDDRTVLTWQQDPLGVEVTLRDCPLEHEDGVSLPPLQFLPQGPARCVLGEKRSTILKTWNIQKPTVADGALVLTPASGPFEVVLVWFDGQDRATRIVARHPPSGKAKPKAVQAGRAVQEAWAQEIRAFGWPRRQEAGQDQAVQGWGNQDDLTRVRVFWQADGRGVPQLFTEWKHVAQP